MTMEDFFSIVIAIFLAIGIVFCFVTDYHSDNRKIVIRNNKKTIEYNDTIYILVPATLE